MLIGAHKRAAASDTGAVGCVEMTRADSDIVLQQETHQIHHQIGEMAIISHDPGVLGVSRPGCLLPRYPPRQKGLLGHVATLRHGNHAVWPALGVILHQALPLDHQDGVEAVAKGVDAGHKAEVTGHFRGGYAGWLAPVKGNHLQMSL